MFAWCHFGSSIDAAGACHRHRSQIAASANYKSGRHIASAMVILVQSHQPKRYSQRCASAGVGASNECVKKDWSQPQYVWPVMRCPPGVPQPLSDVLKDYPLPHHVCTTTKRKKTIRFADDDSTAATSAADDDSIAAADENNKEHYDSTDDDGSIAAADESDKEGCQWCFSPSPPLCPKCRGVTK